MTPDAVVEIGRETLFTAMILAAPVLCVGLTVGLLVAVFQAVTSVQEQTLSMIPKMLAVAVTLILLMPWMINRIVVFAHAAFEQMSGITNG
ncbi:MAG: flagellar biosynthesis protein FliQ [Planctomycetes bacterium]|nr:flagellar biosynthesis protein FliQ [Planctomycetota bacterium]